MSFFEYMSDQVTGLGGGLMICFGVGMLMVIPLSLVMMSLGAKIGTFVGEGVGAILRGIFRI